MYMHGVCTVFLARKSPNIRSYTVYIYGSGQPYIYGEYVRFWPTLLVGRVMPIGKGADGSPERAPFVSFISCASLRGC